LRIRYLTAAAVAATALLGASSAQAETVETVATGLDNPRGVAIGPDGIIYVANAGNGGTKCVGSGEAEQCYGASGRVVKIENGVASNLVRGFYSFTSPGGVFATGVHGVSVAPNGTVVAVTTSTPSEQNRSLPKGARRQVGRLFDVSGGLRTPIARVDTLEWKHNYDKVKGDDNSNPYAVLALKGREIVVDAGANALYEVKKGKPKLFAIIPKNGKSQPVPTSIAQGPDGAIYVGELAEGAGPGKARVFRIPAKGGKPKVYAKGFSGVTGVAFGPDGSLYVTELGLTSETFQGDVIKVAPDGTRTTLGAGKLTAPQGAAVDAAGALFVSTGSVFPGTAATEGPFAGQSGALAKITP
jgi:glucose/arabinose dehydrogenase